MPITGRPMARATVRACWRKVNFLREEPGVSRKRFFVNDVNGPLYILDRDTKKLTTYLNFNGLEGHPGIFHRLTIDNLLASGFISFQFDPDYAHNGKFYSIHMEDPALPASSLPDNKNFPGFKTAGYSVTPAIRTFGETQREVGGDRMDRLRYLQFHVRRHGPRGDAAAVQRAHSSDGRSDFQSDGPARRSRVARHVHLHAATAARASRGRTFASNPQRLDTLVGKILRIIPDLKEQIDSSTVSENGRYRIPKDNPFASKPGARKEIWAYGLRNPYRLSWDVDPADPPTITSSRTSSDCAPGRPSTSFTKAPTTATRCARVPSN